jgi:predicted nucleic acid-binding protein
MKEDIFLDTWGWITIHNKRELRHGEICAFYRNFRTQGGTIYTTDYVLDETLTLLFRRLPFSLARKAVAFLDEATREEYLCIEWVTLERFERAKELRLRFQDKPKISFTDLTSMAIMQELGLISILTD